MEPNLDPFLRRNLEQFLAKTTGSQIYSYHSMGLVQSCQLYVNHFVFHMDESRYSELRTWIEKLPYLNVSISHITNENNAATFIDTVLKGMKVKRLCIDQSHTPSNVTRKVLQTIESFEELELKATTWKPKDAQLLAKFKPEKIALISCIDVFLAIHTIFKPLNPTYNVLKIGIHSFEPLEQDYSHLPHTLDQLRCKKLCITAIDNLKGKKYLKHLLFASRNFVGLKGLIVDVCYDDSPKCVIEAITEWSKVGPIFNASLKVRITSEHLEVDEQRGLLLALSSLSNIRRFDFEQNKGNLLTEAEALHMVKNVGRDLKRLWLINTLHDDDVFRSKEWIEVIRTTKLKRLYGISIDFTSNKSEFKELMLEAAEQNPHIITFGGADFGRKTLQLRRAEESTLTFLAIRKLRSTGLNVFDKNVMQMIAMELANTYGFSGWYPYYLFGVPLI